MSELLIHDMDTAWASPKKPMFEATSIASSPWGDTGTCNRVIAQAGAAGSTILFKPLPPLDLSQFDELRFWIRGSTRADGSDKSPFYLSFSFHDSADLPGDTHNWLVPINTADRWEQRRIGIDKDRRKSVYAFRFSCQTDQSFVFSVDELLAVREDSFMDVESAIIKRLIHTIQLPGVVDIPILRDVLVGDTDILIRLNYGFNVGNRISLYDGGASLEILDVNMCVHDPIKKTTTLQLVTSVPRDFAMANSKVELMVPAIVENPPAPTPTVTPAIVITQRDAREDLVRSQTFTQRDSFRQVGSQVFCSERPAPRAYHVEYQITPIAPIRKQQLQIQTFLAKQLMIEPVLRVYGVPLPIAILPPPVSLENKLGTLSTFILQVGITLEVAERQQLPWIHRVEVQAGRIEPPPDKESIVLEL